MARMRQVKPQLRTSHVVASWPIHIRYFWVLLWGYLDDEGRGLDIPKAIAGDCFPHDDDITPKKVDNWIRTIVASSGGGKSAPLCRYEVDGRRYLHAVNWEEHQRPNRPTPSRLPPCPIHELLTEPPSSVDDDDSVSSSTNDSVSRRGSPTLRGVEGLRGRGLETTSSSTPERAPPSTDVAARPDNGQPTAQTLVAEWIDHCQKRPPGTVIGQVAKQLKAMLDEGVAADDVRRGLAAWHAKSLHPATLPSVVNEVMNHNGRTANQATTDRKVAAGLALAAKYDSIGGAA